MEPEKKVKLVFVVLLLIVALFTGWKTWAIVRDEILPDLRGEESGEVIWNPYEDRWSFAVSETFDLDIQLTDVHIILRTHNAEEVSAVFEGERRQERQSRRTELVGVEQDGSVRIYEEGKSGDLLGLTSTTVGNGEFRGTLTVSFPANGADFITVRTFSGDISISDAEVEMMILESTKGTLEALSLKVTGSLKLSTFDGNLLLDDFSAADCVISGSTGSTIVKTGTASTLYLEQYSNTLQVTNIKTQGKVTVTGSDSNVTLQNLSASTLDAELSAGNMSLSDITVTGTIALAVAGGKISAEDVMAQNLEATGKSGDMTYRDISAQQIVCKSEDGSIALQVLTDCNITLNNHSGNIDLELPASMGFRLSLGTTSGLREVDYQISKYYLGNAQDNYYECQIGAGDQKVNVETVGGNISIKPWSSPA